MFLVCVPECRNGVGHNVCGVLVFVSCSFWDGFGSLKHLEFLDVQHQRNCHVQSSLPSTQKNVLGGNFIEQPTLIG